MKFDKPMNDLRFDSPTIQLRRLVRGDLKEIAAVYRNAVMALGPPAYAEDQTVVWASYPEDSDAFYGRLSRGITLVADFCGKPIAFGQLEPDDHIAFLYSSPEFARRGIATRIHAALESAARAAGTSILRTEASRISRPFFERRGYEIVASECVERKGVAIERFRMRKLLDDRKCGSRSQFLQ